MPARRGGGRGRSAGAVADQDPFQGAGDGTAPAQGFALGEGALDGFDEFAAPRRGQSAQPGEVGGEPDDLAGVGGTAGVVLGPQPGADADGGAGEGLGQPFRVAGRREDLVLPFGVADAGRVAGAFVEQRVRVRDEGNRPGRRVGG